MFFFPFLYGLATPSAGSLGAPAPLPMLPAPAPDKASQGFADAVSYAGAFGNDLIRKSIGSAASTLTALSSRSSEFFSYIAAWLAYDRMARQASSIMAMGFQAFGLAAPRPVFAGMPAPFFPPGLPAVPAFGSLGLGGAAFNPMAVLTGMVSPWMSLWMPAKPSQALASPVRQTLPFKAAYSMPCFAWSLSIG